jgi:hypothetical protein
MNFKTLFNFEPQMYKNSFEEMHDPKKYSNSNQPFGHISANFCPFVSVFFDLKPTFILFSVKKRKLFDNYSMAYRL